MFRTSTDDSYLVPKLILASYALMVIAGVVAIVDMLMM